MRSRGVTEPTLNREGGIRWREEEEEWTDKNKEEGKYKVVQ